MRERGAKKKRDQSECANHAEGLLEVNAEESRGERVKIQLKFDTLKLATSIE
jgi:hypothetical protein